jgi:hypothetical protein
VYAFSLPFIGFAMVLMYLAGRLRSLFSTTPPASEATGAAAGQKPSGGKKASPEEKRAA